MILHDFPLLLSLAQQMSVFLGIAYLLSKTPAFLPLTNLSPRLPNTLTIYCLLSGFFILGSYFGLAIDDDNLYRGWCGDHFGHYWLADCQTKRHR